MKKFFLPLLLLPLAQTAALCQTPQAIHYQAIARDGAGKPMANEQDINIEFSILEGSVSGQPVYRERHVTDANSFGLFFAEIGRGTVVSGSFSAIDWASGAKFLKVDINGNLQGTTQLLAVPYALYAAAAPEKQVLSIAGNKLSIAPGNTIDLPSSPGGGATTLDQLTDVNTSGVAQGQILQWNGSAWVPANPAPGDNWGSQSVQTAPVFSGNGTAAAPLNLASQNAAAGQVLKWDGSKWTPQNDIGGGTGDNWGSQTAKTDASISGDGTTANPLKIAQQGAANGQVLKWNGSAWLPADVTLSIPPGSVGSNQIIDNSITINDLAPGTIPTALPPSGAAGGDLSGNYPAPTLAKIQGNAVAATAPANGQVLKWDGLVWKPSTDGGDGWGAQKIEHGVEFEGDGTLASKLELAQQNATDGQALVWKNSTSTWRPENVDPSSTNEIQLLSLVGDSLRLSGGGGAVKLPSGAAGWGLAGNAGTNPSTNFIGTTDNQALAFRVNGFQQMKLHVNGRLDIGSNRNTHVGLEAGLSNSAGASNSFFGYAAGAYNTTGQNNTVVGVDAGYLNETGSDNCLFGFNSGLNNTASGQAFFGNQAGESNTTGLSNSFFGNEAGRMNTVGADNSFFGRQAGFSNSTGSKNTFIGKESGKANTIGRDNTAVGSGSLAMNTGGNFNTSLGSGALYASTGEENTALGSGALVSSVAGSQNIAVGARAMFFNNSGNSNTVVGNSALYQNKTGNSNVAVGIYALNRSVSASNLVAVGDSALFSNTSGNQNTAIGSKALWQNTTGYWNTACGNDALYSNTTGDRNTASGAWALITNTTGYGNTATGTLSLRFNTDGYWNTALGDASLVRNTTGSYNTGIGQSALNYNVSGGYNTAIGSDSGPAPTFPDLSNTVSLGSFADVTASNTARIGNTAITSIGGEVGWSNLSDARVKTQIQENIPGLTFIQKLRPVSYRYDTHRQNQLLGITDTAMWEGKYDIEKMTFSGFLAQEVEQAARSVGYDFSGVDAPKNDKSLYGLRYAEFTVPLVKAVQEQQAIIEEQRLQLESQSKVLEEVLARLSALEAKAKAAGKPENR